MSDLCLVKASISRGKRAPHDVKFGRKLGSATAGHHGTSCFDQNHFVALIMLSVQEPGLYTTAFDQFGAYFTRAIGLPDRGELWGIVGLSRSKIKVLRYCTAHAAHAPSYVTS